MEAFNGRWEGSGADAENLDEYMAAIGQSDKRDLFMKKHTYDVNIQGDTITTTMTREGQAPHTQSTKLGQRTEVTIPDLGKVFVTVTFDNNVFVNKQEVGGAVMESRAHIEGNTMIMKSVANGKTMTARLRRV